MTIALFYYEIKFKLKSVSNKYKIKFTIISEKYLKTVFEEGIPVL